MKGDLRVDDLAKWQSDVGEGSVYELVWSNLTHASRGRGKTYKASQRYQFEISLIDSKLCERLLVTVSEPEKTVSWSCDGYKLENRRKAVQELKFLQKGLKLKSTTIETHENEEMRGPIIAAELVGNKTVRAWWSDDDSYKIRIDLQTPSPQQLDSVVGYLVRTYLTRPIARKEAVRTLSASEKKELAMSRNRVAQVRALEKQKHTLSNAVERIQAYDELLRMHIPAGSESQSKRNAQQRKTWEKNRQLSVKKLETSWPKRKKQAMESCRKGRAMVDSTNQKLELASLQGQTKKIDKNTAKWQEEIKSGIAQMKEAEAQAYQIIGEMNLAGASVSHIKSFADMFRRSCGN